MNFALELLKEAKKRRINTAIETTGYTNWTNLETLCQYLDTILYDIKCIDSGKHKKFTGVSNEKVLDNFKKMCEAFPNIVKIVRTAIVPGFNDTNEDIIEIINFIDGLANVQYELLPYHRLGQPKYEYMGRKYVMGNVKLDDNKMQTLITLVKNQFFFTDKLS